MAITPSSGCTWEASVIFPSGHPLPHFAEKAVAEGRISPKERREILDLFREGLAGYTYFES